MQEVTNIYCLTDGVPDVLETEWRPAKLVNSSVRDPFTGRIASVPLWAIGEPAVGARARVCGHIDLSTEVAWAGSREALRAREASLLDANLFELCIVTVGRVLAERFWEPVWIATSDAKLFRFPDEFTRWISRATTSECTDVARRWSEQPYLGNAADHAAQAVALSFLELLRPLARLACDADASLFARTAGAYVSAPT